MVQGKVCVITEDCVVAAGQTETDRRGENRSTAVCVYLPVATASVASCFCCELCGEAFGNFTSQLEASFIPLKKPSIRYFTFVE